MPVPKRRRSKSKKRSNKANWKIEIPSVRPCPQCGHLTAPHTVCISCGFYKGKQIIQPKIKSVKNKEN